MNALLKRLFLRDFFKSSVWGVSKFRLQRVPEGGACHTEGSVPRGVEGGAWDKSRPIALETVCMGAAGQIGTEGPEC